MASSQNAAIFTQRELKICNRSRAPNRPLLLIGRVHIWNLNVLDILLEFKLDLSAGGTAQIPYDDPGSSKALDDLELTEQLFLRLKQ
uniref:Uncharacterized protein n=1 Tax=Anguilla anguilla TaxID=7936 RepID=A0A0E9QH15_ANGAN